MTSNMRFAPTTVILTIPDLTERPFFGGGCCAVDAADMLRRELEGSRVVTSVIVDSEASEAILTLADPTADLDSVYEMLEDLDYPAERIPQQFVRKEVVE